MALEETVKIVSTLIQAGAILVTAYFASKGLNVWRRQLIGKRKIEVAEETLIATYRVQRALIHVRDSGSFGGEGSSRPRTADEPDETTRLRDSYYVPLERIQKYKDDIAQFSKVRVLAQVYFGPEADKPFDEILQVFNRVAFASRTLTSTLNQRMGRAGERMQPMADRWEAEIWARNDDDEISKAVRNAAREIEGLCRPHLKES